MKLACSTVSVCFNNSTSFSNGDFSSCKNSTKETRLLRSDSTKFKITSILLVQINKLSHTALTTNARVVKVKHDLLHIVLQVNQSKT